MDLWFTNGSRSIFNYCLPRLYFLHLSFVPHAYIFLISYNMHRIDLPYETILSCAATCKSFLHDTMPLLKKLHIDTSYQMDLRVAARYRDIREIRINSLIIERPVGGIKSIEIDFEGSVRMVPFLSRFTQVRTTYIYSLYSLVWGFCL